MTSILRTQRGNRYIIAITNSEPHMILVFYIANSWGSFIHYRGTIFNLKLINE